jgi:hypothetical protein
MLCLHLIEKHCSVATLSVEEIEQDKLYWKKGTHKELSNPFDFRDHYFAKEKGLGN